MAHQRVPPNHDLSNLIAGYFSPTYIGHAVDVGASDGCSVNSTYGLEKLRRWTVLSVEPNPEFWPVLTSERAWVEKCACSNYAGHTVMHVNCQYPEAYSTIGAQPAIQQYPWKDIEVRVETVDALLGKWQFPKLDALCIDVEGTERDVLEGMSLESWKPKIVVLESWQERLHEPYMKERGYRFRSRLIQNEVYERA